MPDDAMRPAPLLLLLIAAACGGCATFPEVDARPTRAALDAPYPRLLPLDRLSGAIPPPVVDPAGALPGRAAALRTRAAGLSGIDPVPPEDEARIADALRRNRN